MASKPYYEIFFNPKHNFYQTVIWENKDKARKLSANTHSRYKDARSWATATVKRLMKERSERPIGEA